MVSERNMTPDLREIILWLIVAPSAVVLVFIAGSAWTVWKYGKCVMLTPWGV